MKVTLKNTRILLWIYRLNIPICGVIYVFLFSDGAGILLQLLIAEFGLVTVLVLIYFVRVLLFFKEATAIIAAYSMYTVMMAAGLVNILFPKLPGYSYSEGLGTLTLVITVLAAFRSFFVKNEIIKFPFMVYGAGMAVVVLPRLFVLTVYTSINNELMSITGDLGLLIMLAATLFLLKRLLNYLNAVKRVDDLQKRLGEQSIAEGEIPEGETPNG